MTTFHHTVLAVDTEQADAADVTGPDGELDAAIGKYTITGSAPTVNDDAGDGYTRGLSWWYDTATDKLYWLTDSTVGAAVWAEVGLDLATPIAVGSGGSGADLSATGGAGPPVEYVKQAGVGAVFTVGVIAAADLPTAIDATKIADGTVTNAEFQYLGDVTSLLQAQLNLKSSTTHKDTHDTGSSDAFAVTDLHDSVARQQIKISGSTIGTRRGINLLPGANITMSGVDSSGDEHVNITINSSGGGGGAAGGWPTAGVVKISGAEYSTFALGIVALAAGEQMIVGEGIFTSNDTTAISGSFLMGSGIGVSFLSTSADDTTLNSGGDITLSRLTARNTIGSGTNAIAFATVEGSENWLYEVEAQSQTGGSTNNIGFFFEGDAWLYNCQAIASGAGGDNFAIWCNDSGATNPTVYVEGGYYTGDVDLEDATCTLILNGPVITGTVNNTGGGTISGFYLNAAGDEITFEGKITADNFHDTGTENTFVGEDAGNLTTSGDGGNVATGFEAGVALTTSRFSTLIGAEAGKATTTGRANTAIGNKALLVNISGEDITAIGANALDNCLATDNTALGKLAGETVTTGIQNTLIGRAADVVTATHSNATALGYNAKVGAANTIIFGDANVVGVGMGGITITSGMLHVDNPSVAQPVAYFDQGDVSEEMFEFNTTIGVGNAIEAIGAKTLTTTHFVKVTLTPGGLTRYFPVGTIA